MHDQNIRFVLVQSKQLFELVLNAASELRNGFKTWAEAVEPPMAWAKLLELLHEGLGTENLVATFPFAQLCNQLALQPECWAEKFGSLSCPRQGAAEQCLSLDLLRSGQSITERQHLRAT